MENNNTTKTPNGDLRNVRPLWADLVKWVRSSFSKEEDVIPADEAYCRSTYGERTNVESLIKLHQHRISKLIKDKVLLKTDGNNFSGYRCVYSFPNDMEAYIDEILKIFIEKGYKIINLSEKVDELKSDNVYLISWYRNKLTK